MPQVSLREIVAACDRLLDAPGIQDWEGAVNGLQAQNRGTVTRLAAAVDATTATVRMAVEAGADLLLVHHGLFWGGSHPWTGRRYEVLQLLIEHNLAVYSSHLPLDCHPRIGNNILLCRALGFKRARSFFFDRGAALGVQCAGPVSRDELGGRLAQLTGRAPVLLPGGPKICQRIGVLSGGAGSDLHIAAREGVDTFVSGEGPHWTYGAAEDLGLNVFYAGHYATETLGVQALAARLARTFKLPWSFLDHPTGL